MLTENMNVNSLLWCVCVCGAGPAGVPVAGAEEVVQGGRSREGGGRALRGRDGARRTD